MDTTYNIIHGITYGYMEKNTFRIWNEMVSNIGGWTDISWLFDVKLILSAILVVAVMSAIKFLLNIVSKIGIYLVKWAGAAFVCYVIFEVVTKSQISSWGNRNGNGGSSATGCFCPSLGGYSWWYDDCGDCPFREQVQFKKGYYHSTKLDDDTNNNWTNNSDDIDNQGEQEQKEEEGYKREASSAGSIHDNTNNQNTARHDIVNWSFKVKQAYDEAIKILMK